MTDYFPDQALNIRGVLKSTRLNKKGYVKCIEYVELHKWLLVSITESVGTCTGVGT